ncbi:MAG: acyloxyacyl hydrolase [Phycisphaerales bacterium]
MIRTLASIVAALIGPVAFAQDAVPSVAVETPPLGLRYLNEPSARGQPDNDVSKSDAVLQAAAAPRFGTEGSEWWTFGLGVAHNLDDATDYNLRAAYSQFLIDRVEFSLELNAWYFDQDGDNAFGINPAMIVRLHFLQSERWTAYIDPGIGLLLASDNVPDMGTGFDFMPRIGLGITYALTEDQGGPRLQAGIRWHHISNARIQGDIGNPSRDSGMIYCGIMIPF